MYVLGQVVNASKYPLSENEVNSKYMRFGVNVLWRFIQGEAFYNMGEAINYLGFSTGFAY